MRTHTHTHAYFYPESPQGLLQPRSQGRVHGQAQGRQIHVVISNASCATAIQLPSGPPHAFTNTRACTQAWAHTDTHTHTQSRARAETQFYTSCCHKFPQAECAKKRLTNEKQRCDGNKGKTERVGVERKGENDGSEGRTTTAREAKGRGTSVKQQDPRGGEDKKQTEPPSETLQTHIIITTTPSSCGAL